MRTLNSRIEPRPGMTRRALVRSCRRAIYTATAEYWEGTRSALRQCVRKLIKPMRTDIGWMLRVVREAQFAALVAGLVLATGIAGPAAASSPIELSGIAMDANAGGFVMNGIGLGDYAGFSVSGAGDVNGDGLADVIVGAYRADPNGIGSGESYVVFGKATGTGVQLSSIRAGSGGFAIKGNTSYDDSGFGVSGAGDVNGDGLADLIVGAPRADPDGRDIAGEMYVIFGKIGTGTVELSAVAGGVGGFIINGKEADDDTGESVSGAGDVNGDGLADLIVGSTDADPGGREDAGESYVVFGKADMSPVELSGIDMGIGGFIIRGANEYDEAGTSVSGAGDVNGDGLADLIVGAPKAGADGRAYAGRSYIVFGKANGVPVQLSSVALGSGGFVINGIASDDTSGEAVSGAGDVNGDGLADLIVVADERSPGGTYAAGESYVVFGRAGPMPVELSDVTSGIGGFVMNGFNVEDESGEDVSGAGDVNGDGLADLIVGAKEADPGGRVSAGESYVVFGKADTPAVELSDIAAGNGGFIVNGVDSYDYSGRSVSGAGDVNGDGLADLLVGAAGDDEGGAPRPGEAYVIFSPEIAAASGTYIMKTLPGDGAGGFVAPVTDFGDVARARIDFSDADTADNGAGGASVERVTINRSKAGLSKIVPSSDVADVYWWIRTDRVGFTDAEVTLKYLDNEIAGISGMEADLVILTAPTKAGPWVQLASTVDAARNEISATVTGFSFFVIGNSGVGQQAGAEHWAMFDAE